MKGLQLISLIITVCAYVVIGAGCAMEVRRIPTEFHPAATGTAQTFLVEKDVTVAPTGYERTIKMGSTWKYVGKVPQGSVYKIQNDVFMLEGKHVHEAYCVIEHDTLLGFYLPVENAFVPLSSPLKLPLRAQ